MGCDIHMIAETKSKYQDEGGSWQPMIDPIFKDKYFDTNSSISEWNVPYTFQPYDGRNYVLFSILADVRNYYDEPILPISKPKGYPEDMHDVSKWLLDEWDFADHSFTWLTLEEVFSYSWTSDFTRKGIVELKEYAVFKEKGAPSSWSQGVSGGRVVMKSNEEMDALLTGLVPLDPSKSYYTSITWTDNYSRVCSDFLENMNVLKAYADDENADIRLVFGFDN